MRPAALIVLVDDAIRSQLGDLMSRAGLAWCGDATVRGAIERLRTGAGLEPVVVVIDSAALRPELGVWNAALRADRRLSTIPLLLFAEETGMEPFAAGPNVRAVIAYSDGVAALGTAVARVAPTVASDPRFARGSQRVEAHTLTTDLHAYAHAKLVLYFREPRATAVMQQITVALPGGRIVTTTDLRVAAARLERMGELEKTVATLLTGRATLLDSDRTLRS
jgi:hypothetical protein